MLLSKSCVYGLRAIMFIAVLEKESYVPINDISKKLDISFYFLTKILQTLTREKILQSFKGPNGGVRLARLPQDITLMDIVLALDGPKAFEECILGLPGCGIRKPCPLHDDWFRALDIIKAKLNNTTLADLTKMIKEKEIRITELNDSKLFE